MQSSFPERPWRRDSCTQRNAAAQCREYVSGSNLAAAAGARPRGEAPLHGVHSQSS